MNHRIGTALTCFGLLAACSLINAPETLQSGSGGSSTGATGSGGKGNTAGSNSQGGDDGTAGTVIGMGGCGLECGEGGVPPLGRDCDVSADDCGSTAPICDASEGVCRPCEGNPECSTELGVPYCLTSGANAGRCAECTGNADCPDEKPICNAVGTCRVCAAHDECQSGVCDGELGSCVTENQTVYVLAQTGTNEDGCGTIAMPCLTVSHAASLLSAARPNLVLLETTVAFEYESVSLPAVPGLRVIGNGVTTKSSGGSSVFRVPAGAVVVFDNVVIEGAIDEDEAGIECNDADITINDSTLRDNGMGLFALGCDVTVTRSLIQHNAVPLSFNGGGLVVQCTVSGCNKRLSFTQNRFIDNGVALYIGGQQQATIENNLFLRNGADGYTRVIELRAAETRFAYNTLVETFNTCTYVGLVACAAGVCTSIGNISYRSFPAETPPCYDQVWYNTMPSYSLTEIAHPGATNKIGDPLFVDAANGDFTPGPGSPAIDGGNPADAPMVDIDGNPRGAAPDMGAFEAN